jgi:hypothetical protein
MDSIPAHDTDDPAFPFQMRSMLKMNSTAALAARMLEGSPEHFPFSSEMHE